MKGAIKSIFKWACITLFVLYYPTMISIHVTLPLMIGVAGYLIIKGLESSNWKYIVIPLIYLLNLEINLSLPMLLSLFSILVYYLSIYPKLIFLKRCPTCIAILSVIFIDLYYLGFILLYDFIFSTFSIGFNSNLMFSLVMDIVVAVLL